MTVIVPTAVVLQFTVIVVVIGIMSINSKKLLMVSQ